MKVRIGIVHVIANCRDCSWESGNYLTAQALAVRHAKLKRHVVNVEVEKAGTYDCKSEEK